MKQNLTRLLILVLAACLLFALASCTIKFGSAKTAAATTSASTSDPDVSTGTGDATDGDETNTQNTAEDTEPAPSTSGLPVGVDTDDKFGPLHPMPPANP